MIEHVHRAVAIATADAGCTTEVCDWLSEQVWTLLHELGHVRQDAFDDYRTHATPAGLTWLKEVLSA